MDLEPVYIDLNGIWILTEDDLDYLEVDMFNSQPVKQSAATCLIQPSGPLLLDSTSSGPDTGTASPTGYSSLIAAQVHPTTLTTPKAMDLVMTHGPYFPR